MNKYYIEGKKTVNKSKHILRVMRITFFLLFFSILFSQASTSYSQGIELGFNLKLTTVKEVCEEIERKSDFRFIFAGNAKKIIDKKVKIAANSQSIEEILDDILNNTGFTYRILENQVVIYMDESKTISTEIEKIVFEQSVQQNKKQINGRISDKNGEAIIGANIVEVGTMNGTVTDVDGNFSIQVTNEAILRITYIGYLSQDFNTDGRTNFRIELLEDTQALDEIVVVGYGTMRKSDLTGAISSIKSENLSNQSPRSVQDILRANAAGLNIGLATDARAEASLSIRGKGTLASNSEPLIVLDGVIYEGALANINPDDIGSVDVLKDASSAAVYGAKAANGVIVFTTKKGKKGNPVINVNTTIAIAESANQPKILNEIDFLKFRQDYNEGRNSDAYLDKFPQIFTNPFELIGINQIDWYNYDQKIPATSVTNEQLTNQWLSRLNLTTPEIENYIAENITRWDELVFQKALQQSYTVSVSNSTDKTSQYMSLNWVDRDGIITGDRYQTFRTRLNLESKITPFLTVGINTQYAFRNEGFLKSNWNQMTMISPYGSNNIDDPESIYKRRPTGLDPINPFYDNKFTDIKDVKHNINAKLYAEISFPFGIEYTINYTPYLHFSDFYRHYSSKGDNWKAIGGMATRGHSRRYNWQVDNIIHWKKTFQNIHNVEITLLANAEKAEYWYTQASTQTFTPSDILGYHRLQAGTVPEVSSDDTYQTGDALMGRLFYSYKNKYMLTTSLRRDGYSAFGKKNPRAIFPAIALGWVFTQEEKFEKINNWLNYGKLRLSWGENGNREIGQYAALAQMASSLRPYIDQTGNVYSTSQIYVNTMANYNLRWERTASYNLGMDFSLFNNLIDGSIETYISKTNDLLVNRALPDITGFRSVTSNLGQLQNKGLELALNVHMIRNKDVQWTSSANFSLNRRRINKLYGDLIDITDEAGKVVGQKEADDETNEWFIGQDPDRIWAYERAGIWQIEEKEKATIYGCQPGDFKYIDQNDDKIMNNEDKVFQGYRTPRFRWSFNNVVSYKDFTFTTLIYSHWNHFTAFQRAANNYSFPDRTSDYDFPRWTKSNPINDYARIGSKNIGTNFVNKSFVRVENVIMSYNVPRNFTEHFDVQSLRFSLNIQNLFVWAPHWNFWDPEGNSVTPRTYSLGINVTL
jgi:TonB-linked SusC/RagA family outer membrane protein